MHEWIDNDEEFLQGRVDREREYIAWRNGTLVKLLSWCRQWT